MSPVCIPIRNRIGASGARCSPRAQATASPARANATTKLSPSPCSTGRTPPWAATSSARLRSKRATAGVISSGWVCHSRVEPSTSARSNVTVPVGSNSLTPRSLQFTSGVSARGSISLMLASVRQPRMAKHQRRREYRPIAPPKSTTPTAQILRVLADGLAPSKPHCRVENTRRQHK